MPWANFDDKYPRHPKNVGLSDGAFRLKTSGICYCAEHSTDGLIAVEAVSGLVPRFRPQYLTELLDKGHWHRPGQGCGTETCPQGDEGGHYIAHDYLQWNLSRERVAAARERKSKGGKKGAESRWHK